MIVRAGVLALLIAFGANPAYCIDAALDVIPAEVTTRTLPKDTPIAVEVRLKAGDAELSSISLSTFSNDGIDTPDVAEGSAVHRVLEALTGWNQDWPKMPLDKASLASATLAIHRQSNNDILYGRANGRAIWLPREFSRSLPADPPRLSCYHRNLTLASLQAMSLGECVDLVAGRYQRGEIVPPLLLQRAREAAHVLDRLGTGDAKGTYRTMSVDAQIKAASWRASIASIAN